jgi:hydrogenase large subunit
MATVVAIDPVTRLEGHLKVEVTVDDATKKVMDARATGTLFRGFETLLQNRDPWDAPHLTQRICGVCPIPHGLAAVMALDQAGKATVPNNARILRNLMLGANFVQSHLLHFYHLAALDYIAGPAMPPWTPDWAVDRRIPAAVNQVLIDHYKEALRCTRMANEMGAIFGGRMPCSPAFIPGGFTATPTASQISQFSTYLSQLISFINEKYLPDVTALASFYPEYATYGRGHGNLLAFGVFDLNATGSSKLLRSGVALQGSRTVQAVNTSLITEQVTYSWYDPSTNNLAPANGSTKPVYPKNGAYSWLKAPRYQSEPMEAGPLARMWVNGDYIQGISVMDRHRARALEALKIAQAMATWVKQLAVGQPVYARYTTPTSGQGVGLTEAPRGALGHWVRIGNRRIAHYQIITPTCWNASPLDNANVRGPIEQALIGLPVQDAARPIEVLRVIHSFDPCLSCAVHVVKPKPSARLRLQAPESVEACP